MKIVKNENGVNYSVDVREIDLDKFVSLSSISKRILNLISKKSMYPKQIAKEFGVHEQNIYYHIKKLEKAKLIEIEKSENINGTVANFYKTINR